MSFVRNGFGSTGTQTAALAFGGYLLNAATTEEYGGSSWTSGGNMNTGMVNGPSCWNTNSCFKNWWTIRRWSHIIRLQLKNMTEQLGQHFQELCTDCKTIGRFCRDSTSSAINFGGSTPPSGTVTNTTEGYDGTSWSAIKLSMATIKKFIGQAVVELQQVAIALCRRKPTSNWK